MFRPLKHTLTSPVIDKVNPAASAAELCVARVCNHQLERSIEACREVEGMLRRESSLRLLVPLTDNLLVCITNQLQLLHKASQDTNDLQFMSTNYTLLISILRQVRFSNCVSIISWVASLSLVSELTYSTILTQETWV